jgi:type IV secretion system protein VirB11
MQNDVRALERQKQKRQMDNFLADIKDLRPYLADPEVTDISTGHDGEIIVKYFTRGKIFTGAKLSSTRIKSIIYSAAMLLDKTIDVIGGAPKLEAVIPPPYNARITGLLPPWVEYPQIRLRLPPKTIYPLEDYVEKGRLKPDEYDLICRFIKDRKNILVGGSTGSGKSTFANACLKKMAEYTPEESFYVVEDVPELQLEARDKTMIAVNPKHAAEAVRTAMRWLPNRIIFGEVRYGEVANELLKSWNTGHAGNITTIHADSSSAMLPRFEDLLREEIKGAIPDLSRTIHLCVHLTATSRGPVVDEALPTRPGYAEKYAGPPQAHSPVKKEGRM